MEALALAPSAGAPVTLLDEAVVIPGQGLRGDRYADGAGTFASGRPGSALTLIDAAVLDALGDLDHRRNVVVRGTDLNALVGREFTLGEARCHGRRLCEPCAHLDRLNGGGVLRTLVHRGGLRADVVEGGTVRVGDRLTPPGPRLTHTASASRTRGAWGGERSASVRRGTCATLTVRVAGSSPPAPLPMPVARCSSTTHLPFRPATACDRGRRPRRAGARRPGGRVGARRARRRAPRGGGADRVDASRASQ